MAKIVLAGEDNACIDAIRAAIESMGHEAFIIDSAVDVVDEVLEQEAALAVLDESMATFDGYELAQMLRAEPKIPASFSIVLLVARDADGRRLDRAGISECFVKGRNSAEFADLLIKLLGEEAGIGIQKESTGFLEN